MVDRLNAAVDGIIRWSKVDEEIRLAHNEKVKNNQKPSMWEYNPKGGMPTELANLETSTFLTSPLGEILCFLPRDVLARLCSKLSPCDFLHLSLACRFLHWRMFTFCTCYTSYTVKMSISDELLSMRDVAEAKWIYTLCSGIIYDDDDLWPEQQFPFNINCFAGENGDRGIFISQPFGLRKPFFFDTLHLSISFPFFCKKFYDKCLPHILAVRRFVRHLDILFYKKRYLSATPAINFSDTNDFLTAINASYYDYQHQFVNNVDIYQNCPYARQMYRVCIAGNTSRDRLNVPVFQNSIGIYEKPHKRTVDATLKNFLAGTTNLLFHEYLNIRRNDNRFPLIESIFRHFGKFEEFLYIRYEFAWGHFYYHIWKKVVKAENGGLFRIMIQKSNSRSPSLASVKIGKEETFDEMDKKYGKRYCETTKWLKMETAVEPDGTEKSDVAVK